MKKSVYKMNNKIYSGNKISQNISAAKHIPHVETKKQTDIKPKIFEVYNLDNNPHFYMRNRLNWYKNFD